SDPDYPSDPNFDPSNPVTSQGHTTVHERGLTGVDSSHINTGSIAVTAPDGLSSINVGGVDVSLTELLNLGSTPVEIDTPGGKLTLTGFTPTADVGGVPTAGELTFSYELETPQDTPVGPTDPGLNSTETISLEVTDAGSGKGIGELVINIIDDVPAITDNGSTPMLTVDETTLGTANTVDFSGAFTVTEGADGATVEYSLVVDSSIATGLTDTLTGETIVLSVNAAGEVEGRTETGDELAFTVSVNAAGEVTLTQLRALEHPDASDPDDALSIAADALQLVATVTDGDGDSEQAQISLGDNLVFLDDGPAPTVAGDASSIDALETQDALAAAGTGDSASTSFAGAFTVDENYGADGAGSVSWTYALGTTEGPSGLTSGGVVINLYLINGEVVGSTAATVDDVDVSNSIFNISVDVAGEV